MEPCRYMLQIEQYGFREYNS